MLTRQIIHNMSNLAQVTPAKFVLLAILFTISLLVYSQAYPLPQPTQRHAVLFQSHLPEPVPTKPDSWIVANQGGFRQSGTLRVILPPGFTNQSGANVFGNMFIGASSLHKSANVLPGTEFTVGIWPPNDQVQYQKPIEIRILINAAQVSPTDLQNLVVMMYDPATDLWAEQPSEFDPSTFELTTRVQQFKPVAKDFPDWGGRTFFCIANRSLNPSTNTTAKTNGNVRAGPGTNYPRVGGVVAGQPLQLVEKTANGGWYKLNNDGWIAASLLSNRPEVPVAKTTPTPLSTPKPTVAP